MKGTIHLQHPYHTLEDFPVEGRMNGEVERKDFLRDPQSITRLAEKVGTCRVYDEGKLIGSVCRTTHQDEEDIISDDSIRIVTLEAHRANPGKTAEDASNTTGPINIVDDSGKTVWTVSVPRFQLDEFTECHQYDEACRCLQCCALREIADADTLQYLESAVSNAGPTIYLFIDQYEDSTGVKAFFSKEKRDEAVKETIDRLIVSEGGADNQKELSDIDMMFKKGWFDEAVDAAARYFDSRFILQEIKVNE
jgi:hypothetical protein